MSAQHDPTELTLGLVDLNSKTWAKVRAVLEARIDLYRRKNDNDMPPDQTAALRGRIQELKYLLAAGEAQDEQP